MPALLNETSSLHVVRLAIKRRDKAELRYSMNALAAKGITTLVIVVLAAGIIISFIVSRPISRSQK